MESKMFDYICETPAALTGIISRRKEITKDFVSRFKDVGIEQIYVIGSGTSYHAGLAAKLYLEELLGIKVFNMYPTQFARERGLHTAAVSENPTALIFEHADTSTKIEVGNEKCGAKTKGYAGTTVTLMMMLTELAIAKGMVTEEKAAGYRERMFRVIGNLKKVTDASVEWYKRIKDEFLPAKRVIVVGYDGMYCDVLEGALKILETVRQGVAGYDIEEFFHGIYNSITDSAHIFYLASRGDYKPRTMKLVGILSEWTPHNYLIASPDGVDVQSDKNLIVEFVEDPMFSCWEYIIPLQVVACMAPQDLGINPDIPKDPEFHKRIGSKKLDGVRDHYVAQEDTFLKTAVLEK